MKPRWKAHMKPIQILKFLNNSKLWRIAGVLSSVVGLVCYALSSSFTHLFGKRSVLNMLLYGVASFSVFCMMLFARRWPVSRNSLLKPHLVFLALILTSLYSFLYDKAMSGKPDVLSLISSGAFAFMSLSFSRQTHLGFEVGVSNFFLGCLAVQLMKINMVFAFVAAVFCYSIIVLRSYSDSQLEKGTISLRDHVTIDIVTSSNTAQKEPHYEKSSVVSSDGEFSSSESVCESPQKTMDGDNSSSSANLHKSNNSHVKFNIKSFLIPELYIEIPETATVDSLKRTVMEAVTTILGGDMHVGVLLQGKKVSDDDMTLVETGISCKGNFDNLVFILEPSIPHAPPAAWIGDPSQFETSEADMQRHVLRSPSTSFDSRTTDALSDSSSQGKTNSTVESGKSMPSNTEIAKTSDVVHDSHKVGHPELAQRRIKGQPFSISEIETLVLAVEKLGTERWHDVKLLAFENANHRTYEDLKDKWMTLVHTASVSPWERKGESVPQELLDRILSANAYWSHHQAHAYWSHEAKKHGKHQAGTLKITETSAERASDEAIQPLHDDVKIE